jgi:hypothetical protein
MADPAYMAVYAAQAAGGAREGAGVARAVEQRRADQQECGRERIRRDRGDAAARRDRPKKEAGS